MTGGRRGSPGRLEPGAVMGMTITVPCHQTSELLRAKLSSSFKKLTKRRQRCFLELLQPCLFCSGRCRTTSSSMLLLSQGQPSMWDPVMISPAFIMDVCMILGFDKLSNSERANH